MQVFVNLFGFIFCFVFLFVCLFFFIFHLQSNKFYFLINQNKVLSSGRDKVICLYLKIQCFSFLVMNSCGCL